VIDETHRAGATSYLKILDYFTPKFLLGMTATPERTDGADLYKLFDYNIAYEIRLHKALEENMLCPFHYYGVTDLTVNGEVVEDKSDFNRLVAEERVNRIVEQITFYGCDDGNPRGLIFCCRNEEASTLSTLFNKKGFKTLALSGQSSEDERQDAISRIESDDENKLDYIFTVDIFNEGIDIPKINQVVMLRPTQSAIIFVQQLGRGLRKTETKSYLTVIDFIGNYENNYLVPIALYGDRSFNKDTLRKHIASRSNVMPGSSTINFDEITKEKIFNSINKTNMSKLNDLKKDYFNLKSQIGRIPMMCDFLEYGAREPFHFVSYKKSYLNFLMKVETNFDANLSPNLLKLLEVFSLEINNAKRIYESLMLHYLIKHGKVSINAIQKTLKRDFKIGINKDDIESSISNLNFNFVRQKNDNARQVGNELFIGRELKRALDNNVFKAHLLDSTNYSIQAYKSNHSNGEYVNGFIRYQKYSRKDVCRLLNWPTDISSTVYGYRTINDITPCFVTYHKSDNIEESIDYNDHFIDPHTFAWESRSNRRIDSDEIKNVISSKRILLFIKKEDGEGSDFYYIGDCSIEKGSIRQEKMSDGKPVVHFTFKLDKEVEQNLYNYLTQ
jgi:hypothetical protein